MESNPEYNLSGYFNIYKKSSISVFTEVTIREVEEKYIISEKIKQRNKVRLSLLKYLIKVVLKRFDIF